MDNLQKQHYEFKIKNIYTNIIPMKELVFNPEYKPKLIFPLDVSGKQFSWYAWSHNEQNTNLSCFYLKITETNEILLKYKNFSVFYNTALTK